MAAPTITIYAGDFPNRNDPQTKFSNDVGTFLPYFGTIGPEYNIMGEWVNDQVVYIDQAIIDGQAAIDSSVSEAMQYAADAENSANLASSSANFKGRWVDLTGALNIPSSVEHNGSDWQLLANLPDVTASEPTASNPDWKEIKLGQDVVTIDVNFTAESNVVYLASNADITMPTITAGEVFEFHAITDNVRVLNPSYTIKNGTRSITAGDDLLLRNGQTVKLVVTTSNNMEVI